MRLILASLLFVLLVIGQTRSLHEVLESIQQLRLSGDWDEAERILGQSLRQSDSNLFSQDRVQLRLMLATVQADRGDYDAARIRFTEVASEPNAHPDFIARAHAGVLICWLRGQQAKSADAYLNRKVLPEWPRLQGSVSPGVSASLAAWMSLTKTLVQEKEQSAVYAQHAREMLRKRAGSVDADLRAEAWSVLADVATQSESWIEAKEAIEAAIEVIRETLGNDCVALIPYLATLAEVHAQAGNKSSRLEHAQEAWRRIGAQDHPEPAVLLRVCEVYLGALSDSGQRRLRKEVEKQCPEPSRPRTPMAVEINALKG